jgi:chromosome segregation and condensation protein ScpB
MSTTHTIDSMILFCQSDDLSLPELRQKVETIHPNESIRSQQHQLLRQVCSNKKVTLDAVEYLVDLYPKAVKQDIVGGSFLLHLACRNEMCPSLIVKLLLPKYPEAIKI